jgi:hypothetical protein
MLDEEDDDADTLLGALRNIGAAGARGATFNPLARASLGEDNHDLLRRAKPPLNYEELKRAHQVDLNDAKHLADLEDPGLLAHMDQARKHLADHERAAAALPDDESLRRADVEARRSLSSLMTSLKTQQMALQVACDNVLLAATNAQRLVAGDWPHGYPGSGISEKNVTHLGRKVASAGEDLLGIVATFGAFENELTLARRAYEVAISGQTRRSQCFEVAYAEILSLADGGRP